MGINILKTEVYGMMGTDLDADTDTDMNTDTDYLPDTETDMNTDTDTNFYGNKYP